MTHQESIELFRKLGVKMTPELKSASVPMPYDSDGDGVGDYTQEAYAQQVVVPRRRGHGREAARAAVRVERVGLGRLAVVVGEAHGRDGLAHRAHAALRLAGGPLLAERLTCHGPRQHRSDEPLGLLTR